MKYIVTILIIALAPLMMYGQKNQEQDLLVTFTWKWHTTIFTTLQVPAGYKEETENYKEGIITYLRYADGSYIILHRGGMMSLPLLKEPKYGVSKIEELDDRISRQGKMQNTDLFWREDKLKRSDGKGNGLQLLSPNIAFSNVPKNRVELFNQSLNSYLIMSRKKLTSK